MNLVIVRRDPAVRYPSEAGHGPDERLPETPFPETPPGESRVYGLVRECLRDADLDPEHFGTARWNPLGRWIDRGANVFVLPNLVVDRRGEESVSDFQGKCTHGSVVRAVLDYATISAGSAARVGFGNAALQSCDYAKVARETGMSEVARFYRERTGAEVGPCDLRAVVSRWTRYGAMLERYEQRPEDVVLVDLGADSLLDELYRGSSPVEVRVSDYDHRDIKEFHAPGRHVYAVHRRVLEADTIISVPKLKTHEKVGITCALKGAVGAIARKECLAHHRKGGPGQRGDEYPRDTPVHSLASELADRVTLLDSGLTSNVSRVASKGLYKMLRIGRNGIMAGAWHGNDTAWRMALDIARILRFARSDGSLAETPQRRHLVFVDGIVGGEGEGPVYPRAKPAGVVMFGTDPAWTDYACALVMKFAPESIPLVANALRPMRYPATGPAPQGLRIVMNGEPVDAGALTRLLEEGFAPPKGWTGHIEAAG